MNNFIRRGNILRFSPVVSVAFLFFFSPFFLQAQDNAGRQQSLDLVKKNSKAIGLEASQLNDVTISKSFKDKSLDADMVYLQETYLGIPVYNSIKSIAFKMDNPYRYRAMLSMLPNDSKIKRAKARHYSLLMALLLPQNIWD